MNLVTLTVDLDTHVVVPKEPTMNVIVDGFESKPDKTFDGDQYPEEFDDMSGCEKSAFIAKRCYTAMLAAALPYQSVEANDMVPDAYIERRFLNGELVWETATLKKMQEWIADGIRREYSLETIPCFALPQALKENEK